MLTYNILRYFLYYLDFSETKLINIANSELADTLGNLVSRSCGPVLNPRCEFPALHQQELIECCQLQVTTQLLDAVGKLPGTRILSKN